jgi:DNA helicase-2/ATP-dependent DNA helicase PcrA
METPVYLCDLNVAQRAAVEYGAPNAGGADISGPLLIIAGAGTGKTSTLAHRVAHLILMGTLPERILLLTFSRRAAAEMTNRAQRILATARATQQARALGTAGEISWSGTFHAIGNRLLREHADSIGLDPSLPFLIAPIRRIASISSATNWVWRRLRLDSHAKTHALPSTRIL